MGETTHQIADLIDDKREDLKANLEELESRVRSATDWRHYYQKKTGAFIAVAFGGGVLLWNLLGKRSDGVPARGTGIIPTGTKHQVRKSWDPITGALVGAAATKVKDVLREVVPRFSEHVAQVEGDRTRGPTTH